MNSSPPLTPLTLGTVQTGITYGILNKGGLPDEATTIAIYDAALAAGIGWFDTARAYGLAEARIGRWPGRARIGLVSKISAVPEGTAADDWVAAQLAASRAALQTDRIDLILLHRASDIALPGCLHALQKAKAAGQIGGFGVSTYNRDDLLAASRLVTLDAIQIPLNMFDWQLAEDDLLPRLGCHVFARSVFLQGILLQEPRNLPTSLAVCSPVLSALQALAVAERMTMMELALGFVRSIPGVSSIVVGADSPAQIRQSAASLPADMLSPSLIRKVRMLTQSLPRWAVNPSTWPRDKV